MTGYLIDTNVISEARRGQRANSGVRRWFESHADQDLWISVLVVGELRRGSALIRRRDPAAADRLDAWVMSLEASYADRILPVSLDIARRWALLGVPDPVPVVDGLLAATAITHGLVLVTRNTADVGPTGVTCENPFA